MSNADPSSQRVPRVGEIVLLIGPIMPLGEPLELAAIITGVHNPGHPNSAVSLTVFYPGKAPDAAGHLKVPFSDQPAEGCWSWRPD